MLSTRPTPKHQSQRGGALIDVMGAVAIASVALLLYKTTLPIPDQDQVGHQVAWLHKYQMDAVTQAVRVKQPDLLRTLIASTSVAYLPDADWTPYLPSALRITAADGTSQARLNAWQQKPCVLVRQVFSKNFNNQDVATGFLDVVLAQTGGSATALVGTDVGMNLVLASLQSAGLPAGYTGSSDAPPTYNTSWFVKKTPWSALANSDAGKLCNGAEVQWQNRIWSQWQIDPVGQRVIAPSNSEYLARYSTSSSWMQEMDAPMWLSARSNNLLATDPKASLYNLSALPIQARDSNCDRATSEGFFARSTDVPPQLLQCKNQAGVYKWQDSSNVIASDTVLSKTIVLTQTATENSDCTSTHLLGTLAYMKETGAPMVCTGTPTVRKWVRVGVPWAWVTAPKLLYVNLGSEYTFDADQSGVPVSATIVQLYIEGTTSAAGQAATITMEEAGSGKPASVVFEIPAYSGGPAVLGFPRLINREVGLKYKFVITPATAKLTVNLLGYAY